MERQWQQLFVSMLSHKAIPIHYNPESRGGQWKRQNNKSGLSIVHCLHPVQMSLLEMAANDSSLELHKSSYNLVIISLSEII